MLEVLTKEYELKKNRIEKKEHLVLVRNI